MVGVSGVHVNCSNPHRFQLPLLTKLLTLALGCQYVPWSPQTPLAYVFLVFTLDTCPKMWSVHTCLQEEASQPAKEPPGERDQAGYEINKGKLWLSPHETKWPGIWGPQDHLLQCEQGWETPIACKEFRPLPSRN